MMNLTQKKFVRYILSNGTKKKPINFGLYNYRHIKSYIVESFQFYVFGNFPIGYHKEEYDLRKFVSDYINWSERFPKQMYV